MRDDDIVSNNSNNQTFQEVVEARVSRRGFLGGGLATAAALSLGGIDALLKAVPASAQNRGRGPRRPLLGFQGIAVSDADTVVVPPGYTAEVLIAWGDPVSNGPAFEPDASNSELGLVLIRPDGHVAWRGDSVPEAASDIIDRIRGAV